MLTNASHSAEVLRARNMHDKMKLDEHEQIISQNPSESELIKQLSEVNQQNEAHLMKQLMNQFDSMKRDIRHLKNSSGGPESSII